MAVKSRLQPLYEGRWVFKLSVAILLSFRKFTWLCLLPRYIWKGSYSIPRTAVLWIWTDNTHFGSVLTLYGIGLLRNTLKFLCHRRALALPHYVGGVLLNFSVMGHNVMKGLTVSKPNWLIVYLRMGNIFTASSYRTRSSIETRIFISAGSHYIIA